MTAVNAADSPQCSLMTHEPSQTTNESANFLLLIFLWNLIGLLIPLICFHWYMIRAELQEKGPVKYSHHGSLPKDRTKETAIHRSSLLDHGSALVERPPKSSIQSLYDLMCYATQAHASKPLFGARTLKRVVHEEKVVVKQSHGQKEALKETKKWTLFDMSNYDWWTYAQVNTKVHQLGSGLQFLGLKPLDKLTLFASTSREWMMMAQAGFSQNLTLTTAYDTLGEQGLTFSVQECESKALFTQADLLPLMQNVLSNCPSVKAVIYAASRNGQSSKDIQALVQNLEQAFPKVKILSFSQLICLGKEFPGQAYPPSSDDLALIMYTSGSTGNPKGVMLTHGNIIAAVGGAVHILDGKLGDTYLAYLPLAHILEFLVESFSMFMGLKIGYGSVRTLTEASMVRGCLGDLKALKPTLLVGVPMVYETIRKGILGQVQKLSPSQKKMFDYAFQMKWRLIEWGLPEWTHFPVDRAVFKKIQASTGGRLKILISGGAPIPKDSQKFLSVCVAPLVQGYGMTETVGTLAGQDPSHFKALGHVGGPVPNCEVKLVAVPNTAYCPSRNQGEVWVRGPSIMRGYYKRPELTLESFQGDWFKTGDIGEWREDGCLQIIDRKKNLVKLSNGEYIALEKLEAQYKSSPSVLNLCVLADPHQSFPIAIISLSEKPFLSFISNLDNEEKMKWQDMDFSELASDAGVRKVVITELIRVAKQAGLRGAELLGNLHLVTEEWTVQNGILTAAQKIKRHEIQTRYKQQIDECYSQGRI